MVAQILLARRYIENWYFWFVADSVYIFLYTIKQLPFHIGLMCIYLGLAIQGIRSWQHYANKNDDKEAESFQE